MSQDCRNSCAENYTMQVEDDWEWDCHSPARDCIRRRLYPITIACVTVVALGVRLASYPYSSGDLIDSLQIWYTQLHANGLGVNPPGCDYNLPYLTILYLLGQITDRAVIAVKTFSVICDFGLATSSARLISTMLGTKHPRRRLISTVTYAVVLLLPEVVLNSGLWGQCDVLYTIFCVLAMTCSVKRNMVPTFLFMGLGLAFKLQAVFLFPALILIWMSDRKCRLWYFLLIPSVMLATAIPAALAGRSIWEAFTIYLTQQIGRRFLTSGCPNLYSFLLPMASYNAFACIGILLLSVILLLAAIMVMRAGRRLCTGELLLLGVWCSFLCVYFLPNMHERYTYLTDLLLTLLAIYTRRRGDMLCAIVSIVVSSMSQIQYLFATVTLPDWAWALVRLGCLLYLTVRVLCSLAPEFLTHGNIPSRPNI